MLEFNNEITILKAIDYENFFTNNNFFLFCYIAILADTLIEETAVITHIADGDTIDVHYLGSSEEKRIRLLGIQAMEIHPTAPGTPNDCYADEATQRLTDLIGDIGSTVILRSLNASTKIRNRLARHLFINKNGQEINVGEKLLEEGLVLPFLHESETTYNNTYMLAAKIAKANHLGIWSSINHCPTPADSANSMEISQTFFHLFHFSPSTDFTNCIPPVSLFAFHFLKV